MSGAAGHLQHLHENLELTFGELKDVLTRASEGRLEQVSEKLDGMNLMFSWNELEGRLVVARNLTDLRKGGTDLSGLVAKFADKAHVSSAFRDAWRVLSDVVSSIPSGDRRSVFGRMGADFWYSIEIVYASDPNTIRYSGNNLVFHTHPVFNTNGKSTQLGNAKWLAQNIEKYQQAVSMRDWRVRGPARIQLEKIADSDALADALEDIDELMSYHIMDDSDTLRSYLRASFTREARSLPLPPGTCSSLGAYASGWPGKSSVSDIKRSLTAEQRRIVDSFVEEIPALTKEIIAPIEQVIIRFTSKLLEGIQTVLVDDRDEEVSRIRKRVQKAAELIRRSGNVAALAVLNHELNRLGTLENITSPTEGIVFTYKGQTYKFTGAFAPVHQILALFKYGRKGIPKMEGLDDD